jgi:hypothetical protein
LQLRAARRGARPGQAASAGDGNGKRIRTIDVHAHCRFREAVALMGSEATVTPSLVKGDQEQFIVIEERLKTMDAMAIDMEVLSINPFWYRKDRDTAAKIVEIQNEKLAELCASHPDRFAAYASLALQYPDLAVQQLDTAMKNKDCAGRRSAPACWTRIFPTRNSIRCGPRPKNSARCCSSIRWGRPN